MESLNELFDGKEERLRYVASDGTQEDSEADNPGTDIDDDDDNDDDDIEDLEVEELETAAEADVETRTIRITIEAEALLGVKLSDIEMRVRDLLSETAEIHEVTSVDIDEA